MKYHFTLDRKAIAMLAAGLGLAGALVFADGMFVGMGLYRRSVMPILLAAQREQSSHPANTALAALPPAAASVAASATALTAATVPPLKPQASASPASAPPPTAPAAAPVAEAAAVAPDEGCGQAAPASTAAAPAVGEPAFALQLGSFEDAGNATRLVADLKTHGCTAVVSQITDADHRVWNVVRVGPYGSLEDAARAAAAMRRTQGILALVRPVRTI